MHVPFCYSLWILEYTEMCVNIVGWREVIASADCLTILLFTLPHRRTDAHDCIQFTEAHRLDGSLGMVLEVNSSIGYIYIGKCAIVQLHC